MTASLFAGLGRPLEASAAEAPPRKLPPLSKTLGTIENQLVVRFEPRVARARADAAIRSTGGKVRKSLRFRNLKLASYGSAAQAEKAFEGLRARSDVASVFYNQRVKRPEIVGAPDLSRIRKSALTPKGRRIPAGFASELIRSADASGRSVQAVTSLRSYQYHLDRIGEPLAGTPDPNAPTVAVVDTGLDYTNPDLAAAYQPCPVVEGLPCDLAQFDNDPMDTDGHGSFVAGTIASSGQATGLRGVSPNSKILPVRIFSAFGYTDLVTIFEAMDYVVQAKRQLPNLRAANMSFGTYVLANGEAFQEMNARTSLLRRVGVLPVAAAGNDSNEIVNAYGLIFGIELRAVPAQARGVLPVAATDQTDYRTYFSAYSSPVLINNCRNAEFFFGQKYCSANNTYKRKIYRLADISAPGIEVLVPGIDGQAIRVGGTSFSSPIVAGSAARVMARFPGLTLTQVVRRLTRTGTPLGIGKGFPIRTPRVDLRRALGVRGTGFTGRVVDGVTGRPVEGAQVQLAGGGTATTNAAGFYTITGAPGGAVSALSARKGASAASPGYVPGSRSARARTERLVDPGDISLAPVRTDDAYTIIVDWNNVATGFIEYVDREFFRDARGRQYPFPVRISSLPFGLLSSRFSVPYPRLEGERAEFGISFTNYYLSPGSLTGFPYASLQHSGLFDLSPHEGTIVRQLPADIGSFRFGVEFISPGGFTRPDAVARIFRGTRELRRSELSDSAAPVDGTRGRGTGGFFEGSLWQLYDLRSGRAGVLRVPGGLGSGRRSDYNAYVAGNNDIPGQRGPRVGGRVSASLDVRFDPEERGAAYYDYADVYRFDLEAGETYEFVLNKQRDDAYYMVLYAPGTNTIFTFDFESFVTGGFPEEPDAREVRFRYRVPRGKAGTYYLAVQAFGEGSGPYTLSRPRR